MDSNFESGLRTGIDDLLDHRARPRPPALFRADEAHWLTCASEDELPLYVLVFAHSRVYVASPTGFSDWESDCEKRRRGPLWPHMQVLWRQQPRVITADELLLGNLERARKALSTGELKSAEPRPRSRPLVPDYFTEVNVLVFHEWSKAELPVINGPWAERSALDVPIGGVAYRFPYRNRLLDVLQAVAWKASEEEAKSGWLINSRVAEISHKHRAGRRAGGANVVTGQ